MTKEQQDEFTKRVSSDEKLVKYLIGNSGGVLDFNDILVADDNKNADKILQMFADYLNEIGKTKIPSTAESNAESIADFAKNDPEGMKFVLDLMKNGGGNLGDFLNKGNRK